MNKSLEKIVGKIPVSITGDVHDDELKMVFSDGTSCRWYHEQECCEQVVIEDITGDFLDLIGRPLLVADERVSEGDEPSDFESHTWTFYTFRSFRGSVDVRWHGSSNGYYSERVYFEFLGLS